MQYMKLDAPVRLELLQELACMPDYVRQAFTSLPADALTKPGPNGLFSPVEQVWHLADLEVEGFGFRIEALRNQPDPELPDFDGAAVATARDYKSLSLEEGLKRFELGRRENLKRLSALTDAQWNNGGTQEGVGRVSLCDMPIFLRQHDQAHREEIRVWFQSQERVA
jgi:hypothetical protein